MRWALDMKTTHNEKSLKIKHFHFNTANTGIYFRHF